MLLKPKFPITLKMFATPGIGEVDQPIAALSGSGRIKFQGSLWRAQWHSAVPSTPRKLLPSETVWVVGRIGLTLLVQPYGMFSNELDRNSPLSDKRNPSPF